MTYRGRDLSPPGTRVRNIQTDTSQYKTYAIQAIVGALACDVILFGLIAVLLSVGWPVLFVISLLLAYYGTLWIITVYEKLSGNALSYQESMRLAWAFVVSIAVSDYFFISGWWEWLICKEMIILLIVETFSPLKLPSWIYYSLIGLWFLGALKKWGKVTFIAILAVLLIWNISQIKYTVDFAVIWSRVRYFAATLLLPWILFGFILALAMAKELVAPNLNFILDTIPWSDYKQAGGFVGLLFPKLVEWKEQISNRVSYNVTVMGRKKSHGKPTQQKRRSLFAPVNDAEGLAKFAIALLNDSASFSARGNDRQKGACDYGYTQNSYKELRDIAHQLGMLDKQGNKYTLNDYGIETMEGIIERTPGYGIDFVPSPTP